MTMCASPASQRLIDICLYFDKFPHTDYSRPRLVRATHDYSVSQDARDCFLRAFFEATDLQLGENEPIDYEKLKPKFEEFANYLFNNFFFAYESFNEEDPLALPCIAFCSSRSTGSRWATVRWNRGAITYSKTGLSYPRPSSLHNIPKL
ncbi:hypothetical protein F5Y06DRAFT_66937 [Hypoxylon sp. FL0890]|nr:hypothetical protein F5Y06DRAFT_66937 [Hypoxylon sp. FL0890]